MSAPPMRLKKFVADTINEAWLLAREEFGPDALILTSRKVPRSEWGGLYQKEQIEITAAEPPGAGDETDCGTAPPPPTPLRPAAPSRPDALPRGSSATDTRTPGRPEIHHSRPIATATTADRGVAPRATAGGWNPEPAQKPISGYGPAGNPIPLTGWAPDDPDPAGPLRPASPGPSGIRTILSPLRPRSIAPDRGGDAIRDIASESFHDEATARDRLLSDILANVSRPRPPATMAEPAPPRESLAPTAKARPVTALGATAVPQAPPTTPVVGIGPEEVRVLIRQVNALTAMISELQQRGAEAVARPAVVALPAGLAALRHRLELAETPDWVTARIIGDLEASVPAGLHQDEGAVRAAFTRYLGEQLQFSPDIPRRDANGPVIVAMIGPTGVGKTTTIAKLAAHFALSLDAAIRRKVALFSLDTYRIGAPMQIAQYATIIDVPFEIIADAAELPEKVAQHGDLDLILLDTAGRSQSNQAEMEELQRFLAQVPQSIRLLALTASTRYSDLLDRERRFREIVGYDHLVITKIDETATLGPVLGLALERGRSLAFVTNGQGVPEDLQNASLDLFQRGLFPTDQAAG